jgi:hypothetical protein
MKAPVMNLHRPNRPDAAPGLLALLTGIVVLVAAMQYLDTLKDRGEALDERETSIAQREKTFESISRAHRKADNPKAAALMAQQRYATEPARDLIEGGWNPNIAFLTIDLITASRQINMQIETRSAQEALSYAEWLQAQPATESVTIRRQTDKPGPPVRSVETALQVIWKPFAAKPPGKAATASSAAPAASAASAQSPGGAPK